MRKSTAPFLVALLFLSSACAPRVRDVVITVRPGQVTKDAPTFIGVGDVLRVSVVDSTYANRYLVRDTALTLTAMDATAMSGDTTLKLMSLAFAPSRVPGSTDVTVPSTVTQPLPAVAPFLMTPAVARQRNYRALLDSIQAETDLLKMAADTMESLLESLRGRLRTDRGEHARVTLLQDITWFGDARQMLNDPGLATADALLASLRSSSPPRLTPDALYSHRRQFEEYGRRLEIFRVLLPAEPPAALSDTSSVPFQLETLARFSVIHDSVFRRRAAKVPRAQLLAAQLEGEAPIPTAPRHPDLVVVGMDLSRLLASPAELQDRMVAARDRLDRVNAGTMRVVTAANQLPLWTFSGDSSRILASVYPAEKEVKLVVTRRDRFARWTTGAAAGSAPAPASPKPASSTATSGSTTVTTVTTVTAAEPKEKEGSGGSSAAAAPAAASIPLVVVPRTDDTVAVLSIPVLQRYRFRLGVGMAFSQLETTALETVPGEVDGDSGVFVLHKGTNEHRFIPIALLSMTILPLEGRYVDGRARRYPWSNPSVSVQGGVSLQSPTEQLYAGIAVEPLPGLEVGAGRHWAYVETTGQPSGGFVKRSNGTATSKQWLDDWAFSFTLDATTFVRAFSGLLGL